MILTLSGPLVVTIMLLSLLGPLANSGTLMNRSSVFILKVQNYTSYGPSLFMIGFFCVCIVGLETHGEFGFVFLLFLVFTV